MITGGVREKPVRIPIPCWKPLIPSVAQVKVMARGSHDSHTPGIMVFPTTPPIQAP